MMGDSNHETPLDNDETITYHMDELSQNVLGFNLEEVPENAIVLGEVPTTVPHHLRGLSQSFIDFCNGLPPKTVEHHELDSKVYHAFVAQWSTFVPSLSIDALKDMFYQQIVATDGSVSCRKLKDDERDVFIWQMFFSNAPLEPDNADMELDPLLEYDPFDETTGIIINFGLALSELPSKSIILGLHKQHVESIPELSVRYRDDCESKRRREIPIEKLEEFFYRPFMANNADFFPLQNMDEFNGIFYQYINQDGISYCTLVSDEKRDEAVKKDLYNYDLPVNAIVLGSNTNKQYLTPLTVKYSEHRNTLPRQYIPYNKLEERFYRPFMAKNRDFFPRQHMDEFHGCFFQYKEQDKGNKKVQGDVMYYQRVSDDEMDKSIRDDIQRNGYRAKRPPNIQDDIRTKLGNIQTSEFDTHPGLVVTIKSMAKSMEDNLFNNKWLNAPMDETALKDAMEFLKYAEKFCSKKRRIEGQIDNIPNVLFGHSVEENFFFAAQEGNISLMRECIAKGLDVNLCNNEGVSALHRASRNGRLNIVQYLLVDCNENVSTPTENGTTALHFACFNGHLNVVRLLINGHNASVERQNSGGWTPLHYASNNGHLDVVQYLLMDCKANVNTSSESGATALHRACWNSHLEVVRLLINSYNVNVECQNCDGLTPLHYASENGNLDIVQCLLLSRDVNVDIPDKYGSTPLHLACLNGHLDVVRFLINGYNVNVECQDSDKWTPLHYASAYGQLDVVKYLLMHCKAHVNTRDQRGATALHQACMNGHKDVVQYLINSYNVNMECQNSKGRSPLRYACYSGCTPLHYASACGQLDVVQYLLVDCKANVNTPDIDGTASLHLACQNGHLDVVQFLISSYSANVECQDSSGCTPLHYACENGHLDIVQYLLLSRDANVDGPDETSVTALNVAANDDVDMKLQRNRMVELKDIEGCTPLHTASDRGHLDIVIFLVKDAHAMVEAQSEGGWSALHCASSGGHLNIVQFFIEECQVNAEIQDNDECTPVHVACCSGHLDVVQYLVETHHVDVGRKNTDDGCTPLHYASKRGHLSVVKYLVQHCNVNVYETNMDGKTACQLALESTKVSLGHTHTHGHHDIVTFLDECKQQISVISTSSTDISVTL